MDQKHIDNLSKTFPRLIFQKNIVLAPFTFMKVGGAASLYVEVTKQDDLHAVSAYCFQNHLPFVILGGASNTIIPDAGLHRLVIRNKTSDVIFHEGEGERVRVTVDSGVVTATLSNLTIQKGLTGLEHFVGVPGTVGGAIYNNSHFTAHELIGNFISSVEVCTEEGNKESWEKEKLTFGYDYSIFHETKAVILSATFELYKGDPVHIQEKMLEAAKKRTATQPIGVPSSGCMFRNPRVTSSQLQALRALVEVPESAIKTIDGKTQIAAGFLIDQAGLKGATVGGAQVSDKHATYLVNTGEATATDVHLLAQLVEQKVENVFGIKLEREVFFL